METSTNLARKLIVAGAFALAAATTHAATFTVTNTLDSGDGSLLQAINDANIAGGTNTIAFNIPGGGVKTIYVNNTIPNFNNPTTLDGYTQPGSSSNTLAVGNNAILLIEITTTNSSQGFVTQSPGCLIRGIVINGFDPGVSIGIGGPSGVVEGCFIGTDATGTNASPHTTLTGIYCPFGNNRIGGTNPWQRNVISGCGVGIETFNGISTNSLFVGNYIGTDKTGTKAVPNVTGIHIESPGNIISNNVVSGNSGNGILVIAYDALIQGNFIGTDATGTNALGNGNVGIALQSDVGTTIGGTTVEARNIISGNLGTGIDLGNSEQIGVFGNFIGTDVTGTKALGNHVFGLQTGGNSVSNVIGGATAAARNVISGNANTGVLLSGFDNRLEGNFIGVDANGVNFLPNGNGGVNLSVGTPTGNQISSNSISGNTNYGVSFFGAMNNLAEGNTILNNVGDGVLINGSANTVDGNVIEANTGSGISVPNNSGFTNNTFTGNSISGNTLLGIDLLASGEQSGTPTTNDVCDADDGANHLQNFPVLTLASNTVDGITIHGTLNSAASTTFRVEFFANSSCNTSGFGEGELFLGSTNVTTDGSCHATFSALFTNLVTFCDFITATATDPNGNTSEFSQCLPVQAAGVVANSLQPTLATNLVNTAHTVTNTLTADALPLVGETVFFNVISGPNSGESATNTTDAAGVALFTYTGGGTSGSDTIRAVATYCAGAITSTATKVWISGSSSNEPPVARCRDVITNANNSCQANVPASRVDNGSDDPDGVSVTLNLIPSGPFGLGTNNVTLWATDVDGASNSCSAVVIVRDVTAPSIQCAGDIVSNVVSPATSTIVTYPAPTVDDNCGVATNYCLPASGSSFSLGTNTVTCTAVDNSGNTNACLFTVTVQEGVCAVDLTGTWTNLVQTCKVKNEVTSCKVKGTLNVVDIGTENAGSSFIHYFLSDDATLDKGDVFLKQVNTGSVKVGKVKKRKLSAKLPVGVSGSGKYIIAFIDVDGQIDECNEENNIVVFGPIP